MYLFHNPAEHKLTVVDHGVAGGCFKKKEEFDLALLLDILYPHGSRKKCLSEQMVEKLLIAINKKNDHLPKTELYPELPQDMGQ